MQIPDYINPIVAYRAWNINEAGLLQSCTNNTFVVPLEVQVAMCLSSARCGGNLTGTDICPSEYCCCGIYAFKELNIGELSGQVYGEVYLWGKIIPHKVGYRAQFAYPKRFYKMVADVRIGTLDLELRALSELYQVPYINLEFHKKYVECFGIESFYPKMVIEAQETEHSIACTRIIQVPTCNECRGTSRIFVDRENKFICFDCREKAKLSSRCAKYYSLKGETT